jgi:hypothetical protein
MYSSNICVIKSRRMRWGEHVTRMRRAEYKEFWWENRPLGRTRHRWQDKIRCILSKWDGAWNGLIWLQIGTDDRL